MDLIKFSLEMMQVWELTMLVHLLLFPLIILESCFN